MNKKKLTIFIILLFQCITFIVICFTKSNYYCDEYYSMEYANYIKDGGHKYVFDTERFAYDIWMDNGTFREVYLVSKDESVLNKGIAYTLKAFTNQPYDTILNITAASLFPDKFSKWIALIINIPLFIIFQFITYKISLVLTKNNTFISNIIIIVNGLSASMISTVEYIRFYILFAVIIGTCNLYAYENSQRTMLV